MKMGMISGLALTAFVSATPVVQAYANPEKEAMKYLGKACYKQFNINTYAKRVEVYFLNEEVRKYGGAISAGVRIIAEQKISYVWTF